MTNHSHLKHTAIQPLFTAELNDYELPIFQRLATESVDAYLKVADNLDLADSYSEICYCVEFITNRIRSLTEQMAENIERYQTLLVRHKEATSDQEQHSHLADYLSTIAHSKKQLKGDLRSLKRNLSIDTLSERMYRENSRLEFKMRYLVNRLGVVIPYILDNHQEQGLTKTWSRIDITETFQLLFIYENNEYIQLEALKSYEKIVSKLPDSERSKVIDSTTRKLILHNMLIGYRDIWIQNTSLSIIAIAFPDELTRIIDTRLNEPRLDKDGDLFIRAHIVKIILDQQNTNAELEQFLPVLTTDVSDYVRKCLAEQLPHFPPNYLPSTISLFIADKASAVRAQCILSIPALISTEDSPRYLLEHLTKQLQREADTYVLRVLLHTIPGCLTQLIPEKTIFDDFYITALNDVNYLYTETENHVIRRCAAQCREHLCTIYRHQRDSLTSKCQTIIQRLEKNKRVKIPLSYFSDYSLDAVYRVLTHLSRENFCLDIQEKRHCLIIHKDHRTVFRLWRFLFEARRSATDKRQAFSHTTGRDFLGDVHITTNIMAERSQTKVPGEPLFIDDEGGWRPYLPLLDHAVAALDRSWPTSPIRIYSSDGVTLLSPPSSIFSRLRAKCFINWHFSTLSAYRNWTPQSGFKPSQYINTLRKLGFSIEFNTYCDHVDNPLPKESGIPRFIPAITLPSILQLYIQFKHYFLSIYQNTITQLMVFLGIMFTFFFGRHIYSGLEVTRLRRHLPLVIGGWGTRGKSGTERLKAAVLNGMNYRVFSKTTGCEAMFVHSHAFSQLYEMPLFRPYDKATIWEQVNVMRIAVGLEADVFLWECMGLTPSYVKILQKSWMRDDLSTITNTYPDHEDLQGPAGVNIPQVMINFIPDDSVLITSELDMHPILATGAEQANTDFIKVDWIQPGLITSDILDRFPYAEHPNNIALVTRMAHEMGIDESFALKEMADRVVPDLGVLKSFPTATISTRRLEFINGMSANERYATLENWRRMSLFQQTPITHPDTWVVTVVNNRADRIPRSKVFARILVEDLSADAYVLIGTNLDGMRSYINEAWEQKWQGFIFRTAGTDDNLPTPADQFKAITMHYRIATDEIEICHRLNEMLQGIYQHSLSETREHQDTDMKSSAVDPADLHELVGPRNQIPAITSLNEFDKLSAQLALKPEIIPPDLLHAVTRYKNTALTEYNDFQRCQIQLTKSKNEDRELSKSCLEWIKLCFLNRLTVINNPTIVGDKVIQHIVDQTPPGLKARIMGMQNIKGTGLDFAYRWQAWENCFRLGEQVKHAKELRASKALKDLANLRDYGLLSFEYIDQLLHSIRHRPVAQSEIAQAELVLIEKHRNRREKELINSTKESKDSIFINYIFQILENFFDVGDSVKRRKKANEIYSDLIHERISRSQAELELAKINKNQKGGWLKERMNYS